MSDDTREPPQEHGLTDEQLRALDTLSDWAADSREANAMHEAVRHLRTELAALRSERDDIAAALAVANENVTIARGERDAARESLRQAEWTRDRFRRERDTAESDADSLRVDLDMAVQMLDSDRRQEAAKGVIWDDQRLQMIETFRAALTPAPIEGASGGTT